MKPINLALLSLFVFALFYYGKFILLPLFLSLFVYVIIKSLTKILGGSGGGGRPDFARAGGGNDKSKIPKACEAIKELIKSL